jgi:hypothetical protein
MYALASFACFAKLSLLVADFTPAPSFLSFSFFFSWICFLFIPGAQDQCPRQLSWSRIFLEKPNNNLIAKRAGAPAR